jgi:hypothetical protein
MLIEEHLILCAFNALAFSFMLGPIAGPIVAVAWCAFMVWYGL